MNIVQLFHHKLVPATDVFKHSEKETATLRRAQHGLPPIQTAGGEVEMPVPVITNWMAGHRRDLSGCLGPFAVTEKTVGM